jgi:hypothetical protein
MINVHGKFSQDSILFGVHFHVYVSNWRKETAFWRIDSTFTKFFIFFKGRTEGEKGFIYIYILYLWIYGSIRAFCSE